MTYTLLFLELFYIGLKLTAPILLFLALVITGLGQVTGRRESWSRGEALYWAFVTATTVGYGDFRPLQGISRILSILIALCGVVFTGIIVAIAITATTDSIKSQIPPEELQKIIERHRD